MSGKSARAARQALAPFTFPILKTEVTISERLTPQGKWLPAETYTVEADHNRRIRLLARRMNITIREAITLYAAKVGMIPKLNN